MVEWVDIRNNIIIILLWFIIFFLYAQYITTNNPNIALKYLYQIIQGALLVLAGALGIYWFFWRKRKRKEPIKNCYGCGRKFGPTWNHIEFTNKDGKTVCTRCSVKEGKKIISPLLFLMSIGLILGVLYMDMGFFNFYVALGLAGIFMAIYIWSLK